MGHLSIRLTARSVVGKPSLTGLQNGSRLHGRNQSWLLAREMARGSSPLRGKKPRENSEIEMCQHYDRSCIDPGRDIVDQIVGRLP
jgi:hypothetical protein